MTFTVQALPGRTFTGVVQQVRLQSTTVDNVVNYTVVVTLENADGKLLPGMTARVDFLVNSAVNVLKVANAALRYKPSDELLEQFGATPPPTDAHDGFRFGPRRREPRAAPADSVPAGTRALHPDAATAPALSTPSTSHGKLQVARVRTGISDGAATEVRGRDVTEGMKVIDGLASTTTSASQKPAANPLAGAQQGGGGRGRPGGGF